MYVSGDMKRYYIPMAIVILAMIFIAIFGIHKVDPNERKEKRAVDYASVRTELAKVEKADAIMYEDEWCLVKEIRRDKELIIAIWVTSPRDVDKPIYLAFDWNLDRVGKIIRRNENPREWHDIIEEWTQVQVKLLK